MLETLQKYFVQDSDFASIVAGIQSGMKEQLVCGLAGSSRQVMAAVLHRELNRSMVIITHNMFSAQKIAEDMEELLPEGDVLLYPANEITVTESAIASPEMQGQRIKVLSKLAAGFSGVLIVPYAGVRKLLPSKEVFAAKQLTIKVGEEISIQAFTQHLVELGYERTDRVEAPGEMSVRGGIVDFYPLETEHGYRMEWFGDEIDSIRSFDPVEQRSTQTHEWITIIPCREIISDIKRFQNAADHVYDLLQVQLSKMNDRSAKEKLLEVLGKDIEMLRQQMYFQGIFKYISLLYPERHTLLDYIDPDSFILMDEPMRLLETAKQMEKDEAESVALMLQNGESLPSLVLSKTYESQFQYGKFSVLYSSLFLRQIPQTQPQNIVNFMCRAMQNFHGQMNVLKAEMERWKKSGTDILMLANGEDRVERLKRILRDYDIEEPKVLNGNLLAGYEFPAARLTVITEGEIFSQKQRKAKKIEKKMENAERIKSYTELKEGDYVVHVNHGIGKFVGIGTLEINGIHKDYIHIMYSGGDKLSVPIDQIHLVQKYVGAEDKEPKIYKLGGTEWTKAKNKARSSVKDIADDLIKLYAERQSTQGYAFSKDTPYQKEFEGMFPYEETRDQLRAIEEIKKDMQKPYPMDRLLCGDVGYGKTEVAIRAAFKAAIEGKQVAVLVPTTILAQQHYETFKERFSDYPFHIEVLSRFRSRKEQNETTKGLKAGTVDIVIGTHRLLSKDMQFKDLGLLIIDEEQRFGVTHKEKLKQLRTNVDVLTLTATPIPRTLHMSMLGVRDLSVIETPPENRFPVQTYVLEYSPTLVREAIERELSRSGQVYYLYNRVQGIYQMAEQISMLVPDARVAVSHGQMSEQELEKTILDFLDGEYDVLVSTSIIETGVDIPNVNTLIVHDADKLGLSQLYQLRGRVGRSNRIAYAYFTYQRDKVLTEVAEKRLQAIKEFTELGSGFKIAMRDLAIRGAGNLLGSEQHGYIASVGFDMYSQMLAEEIQKRKDLMDGKAEPEKKAVSTQIDMNIDAYLPSDYIYDSMQKIEIYKKVAAVQSLDEADDLLDELIDRFGDPPQAVSNLIDVARLKVYGSLYRILSVIQKGDEIVITIDPEQNSNIDGQKLFEISLQYEKRMKISAGSEIKISVGCRGMSSEQAMELLLRFMAQYTEVLKSKGELQNAAT
ncbi:transcription-repair coupling factor [Marinicrinis lubricantis]|uniref:Transcription-repair-coupling factor n=1 Tax=Marinicrinis lubricantis TaxID=2086470 RepID=A0ABW1IQJ1_9BACL